ncbi:MAG: 3-methyl-2-oxobutanoate hydroxymethyltransferase [Planctomycetia bacterium]|nr:3-methyl-2-oxobutanoate hydroxymethyltransferase [Planctomycetia bacterium]
MTCTIPEFTALKNSHKKISMLTAYDFPTAKIVSKAGIDAILVGDSLATVVQGKPNTLPVTLEEMIYHGEMVCRAAPNTLVIIDLPFPAGHTGWKNLVHDSATVLKKTGCHAVKLECAVGKHSLISRLVEAGIPCMAHLGLRPQMIQVLGKYSLQKERDLLLEEALAAQKAGAFSVLLECVKSEIAQEISETLQVPVIGIGSGKFCDGQVLVLHDILGLSGRVPRHAKQYICLEEMILNACISYREDVENGISVP